MYQQKQPTANMIESNDYAQPSPLLSKQEMELQANAIEGPHPGNPYGHFIERPGYILRQDDTWVQQLNERVIDRRYPSKTMGASFDPRPVRTRHILYPAVDCHMPSNTDIVHHVFMPEATFAPGDNAPYQGYAHAVDVESRIQNMFSSNQKCDQNKYIPSSSSTLYHYNAVGRSEEPVHEGLFREERFNAFNANPQNLGREVLQNHTRVQRKGLPYKQPTLQ